MLKKSLRFIAVVVLILGLAFTMPCADAIAQPHGGGGHGGGHGGGGHGWGGGGGHYYNNGHWYRHSWLGFDIIVGALAVGALIDALPPRYSTVVVADTPYYYFDGYYYRPYPYGGYVVVPPPVLVQPVAVVPQPIPVVAVPQAPAYAVPPASIATQAIPAPAAVTQPQGQAQDVSTINIPNSRGGYTSVTLKKSGSGYLGQQGEYYSDNPTVEQLKVLYGK